MKEFVDCKQVESISEFIDAIRLRVNVFIIEQQCKPGWEPDELDKSSEHYVAQVESKIIATLRVREELAGEFKIERMVTDISMRGRGLGKSLLQYVIYRLVERGATRIWIQAQERAVPFYLKEGFTICSEVYDLWGIPHLDMELNTKNLNFLVR